MKISRQEYWSGSPFLTAENLPNLGTELASLVSPALAGKFFTTAPPGKPIKPPQIKSQGLGASVESKVYSTLI